MCVDEDRDVAERETETERETAPRTAPLNPQELSTGYGTKEILCAECLANSK